MPLLVLVESEALTKPVEAWLEQELASSLAACIGDRKVEAMPRSSELRQAFLLDGVKWLASHGAKQPHFQVRPKFRALALPGKSISCAQSDLTNFL